MKKKNPLAINPSHDEHDPVYVYGTNQADNISLSGGPQYVLAGNGDDYVSAGGGPDTVEGQNGKDLILGGGGPDRLIGGNGNDVILGGGGPDQLFGGNGDDILDGGAAFDILTGGHGADVFVFAAHSEEDGGHEADGHEENTEVHDEPSEIITDFKPGVDKIDLSNFEGVDTFSYEPAKYAIWVEQDGDNAVTYVDTNGDLGGEHPAELSIMLLDVQASSLSASDFIL